MKILLAWRSSRFELTVLGAIALTGNKQTSKQIIDLRPELSIRNLFAELCL